MPHPPVALSCGDPSGIGPEIAARAWAALKDDLPFVWIGDPRHLPPDTPHVLLDAPEDAVMAAAQGVPVLPHPFPAPALPGQPAAENAPAIVSAIERGVALVQSGAAGALCTAPIHKKALKDGAGFAFPGHTEFLAHLAGVERVVMMLACEALKRGAGDDPYSPLRGAGGTYARAAATIRSVSPMPALSGAISAWARPKPCRGRAQSARW